MFSRITLLNYRRPLPQRAEARKHVGPYTWEPAKPGTGRGFYQASTALACDPRGSSFNLRLEEANDHLRYSRLSMIQGYYCDDDGSTGTLQPIIARLPRGRGFLAGWTMGRGMAACVDADVYDDPQDAARAAHDMAERDAEKEREHQARENERLDEEADEEEGA